MAKISNFWGEFRIFDLIFHFRILTKIFNFWIISIFTKISIVVSNVIKIFIFHKKLTKNVDFTEQKSIFSRKNGIRFFLKLRYLTKISKNFDLTKNHICHGNGLWQILFQVIYRYNYLTKKYGFLFYWKILRPS